MILHFRTLRGEELQIEIGPEKTIGDVKEELSTQLDYPANKLKLIFLAKILKNDIKISSINIPDNSYISIHCIHDERPVIPKSQRPEPEVEENIESIVPPQPAPEITNPDIRSMIDVIMEMGFNKKQIEKALRNTDNNIEQAINLLINEGLQSPNTRHNEETHIGTEDKSDQNVQESDDINPSIFGQFKDQYETLSVSEKEAVKRLISTNEDAEMVIQIYIACGKDEVAALSCLQ